MAPSVSCQLMQKNRFNISSMFCKSHLRQNFQFLMVFFRYDIHLGSGKELFSSYVGTTQSFLTLQSIDRATGVTT